MRRSTRSEEIQGDFILSESRLGLKKSAGNCRFSVLIYSGLMVLLKRLCFRVLGRHRREKKDIYKD